MAGLTSMLSIAPIVAGSLAFFVGLSVALLTRGITYYAKNTDNQKIVRGAARFEDWGWPSGMHRYSGGKAVMKECAVISLALVQRLIGRRASEHGLVILCVISNSISAFLIYVIAARYWGEAAGWVAFGLFLGSVWPQLIALWGGVVAVSQLWCFLSVYLFQAAALDEPGEAFFLYLLGGISVGIMLFSSASSRKYVPFSAAAFLWSMRHALIHGISGTAISIAVVAVGFVLAGLVARGFPAITAGWLRAIFPTLAEHAPRMAAIIPRFFMIGAAALAGNLLLSTQGVYWIGLGLVMLGLGTVTLALTYPDVIHNLFNYYAYSSCYGTPVWPSRFQSYRDYFASRGHLIRDDMRGAGLSWVVKYFFLIAPVQSAVFCGCAAFLSVLVATGRAPSGVVLALALGIAPIAVGELTKGPQLGRAYYPGLIGLIFVSGLSAKYAFALLDQNPAVAVSGAAAILVLNAAWSTRLFFGDVLPSRMGVTRMMKVLRSLNIREFFTYDTPFNDSFVACIPEEAAPEFSIRHIESLADVKEGYVVVPGTNIKSVMMSDYPVAKAATSRFAGDPVLEQLLTSRRLEASAVASFKTMGSSRIWVHESEPTTYRDLILREVDSDDLYRGRAWILDAGRLRLAA